jgi:hypothetical protein
MGMGLLNASTYRYETLAHDDPKLVVVLSDWRAHPGSFARDYVLGETDSIFRYYMPAYLRAIAVLKSWGGLPVLYCWVPALLAFLYMASWHWTLLGFGARRAAAALVAILATVPLAHVGGEQLSSGWLGNFTPRFFLNPLLPALFLLLYRYRSSDKALTLLFLLLGLLANIHPSAPLGLAQVAVLVVLLAGLAIGLLMLRRRAP